MSTNALRSRNLWKMGMYETLCFIATNEYQTYVHMDDKSLTFGIHAASNPFTWN